MIKAVHCGDKLVKRTYFPQCPLESGYFLTVFSCKGAYFHDILSQQDIFSKGFLCERTYFPLCPLARGHIFLGVLLQEEAIEKTAS